MGVMGPVCVVPSDATVGWVDRIDVHRILIEYA
jgi:hypothetical protein